MSRPCTVCADPSVAVINEALRSGRSAASLAVEHGIGARAVQRHALRHVVAAVADATAVAGLDDEPLAELVEALRGRAMAGDPAAAREYRLSLAALESAGATAAPVKYADTEEWQALRTAIVDALDPFPEARLAVVEAITRMGGA